MIPVQWMPGHSDILLQTVPEAWAVDDFTASVDEVVTILQAHPDQTIHLVCNMTRSQQLPLGIASHARYVSGQVQPNSGLIVLTGMRRAEVEITRVMRGLIYPLQAHIRLAHTVPEAVALIEAERESDRRSA